ncbi:ABC transporter substrate-binding protein [Pseudochelatococcus sp. B33]
MKKLYCLAIAAFVGIASPAAAQSGKEVIFATTGGVFERALREIWFEPFTEATGIKVVTVTATDAEQRTRAKAMVQSGNVTWDIINNVDVIAESADNRSFTEDLASFCQPFSGREGLLEKACNPAGVQLSLNATLLAYNEEAFPKDGPKTWTDFWNLTSFPGPRALPNLGDPWRVFAAALMADGVPADQLFPLDLDRAIQKLDQIRPHVDLWWRTGDQSQQGFRNGDYVTGMIWGTRASALKAEGRPVATSYAGAFMLADTLQVLRNAPNRENALALLKYFLDSPLVQARIAERFGITPPSTEAIAVMSADARENIPSAEDLRAVVKHDPEWINAHASEMQERWNRWLQQ